MFSFAGADGANPWAGLVTDGAGNFYGTTYNGGTSNEGTVYKITAAGIHSVLHSFAGGSAGANTSAPLIFDGAGYLYGTTQYGGAGNRGTVFRIPVQ